LFKLEELNEAGRSLPRGKAPSPNGVPDEILRIIVRPDLLLPTFNECLKTGVFFDSWKAAQLVYGTVQVQLGCGDQIHHDDSVKEGSGRTGQAGYDLRKLLSVKMVMWLEEQFAGIKPRFYLYIY